MGLLPQHLMAARQIMASIRKITKTAKAGLPVGPYNQAVTVDKTVYVSGCIPLEPASGVMVTGGIEKEAVQVLENFKAVVEASGSSMKNVVKCTILLQDINDWPAVNTIYSQYFTEPYPARAAYQVAALPKGALVEIEGIAIAGDLVDQ